MKNNRISIGKYSGIVRFRKPIEIFKIIPWLGTVTSLIGSFLVANAAFFMGYIMFLIGTILWIIVGRIEKNQALVFSQVVFLIANINGIINNYE